MPEEEIMTTHAFASAWIVGGGIWMLALAGMAAV